MLYGFGVELMYFKNEEFLDGIGKSGEQGRPFSLSEGSKLKIC